MTEPKTHTLDVPGVTLIYDVRSNDSSTEPILLLIGSPMGAAGFGTLSGYFTDRTVVTYDPRGVERSVRTDDATESTPDYDADDLHRLIAALDAGPVDIFASSGGAVNTLALVASHPEQVGTLVAHEPPAAQAATGSRGGTGRGPRHTPDVPAQRHRSRDGEINHARQSQRPDPGRFRRPARSGSCRFRAGDRGRRLQERPDVRTKPRFCVPRLRPPLRGGADLDDLPLLRRDHRPATHGKVRRTDNRFISGDSVPLSGSPLLPQREHHVLPVVADKPARLSLVNGAVSAGDAKRKRSPLDRDPEGSVTGFDDRTSE